MKPSQRIQEIREELQIRFPGSASNLWETEAVIMYLDEVYEKNKPCEHKYSYQVEGYGDIYYNVCDDCGVLFLSKRK